MVTQPKTKSRLEFSTSQAWHAYVSTSVPASARPFVFALGQTILFRRFYEVRGEVFPVEFCVELNRIEALDDPQRTKAIEALNSRIFSEMTQRQLNAIPLNAVGLLSDTHPAGIDKLIVCLDKENEAFALWLRYKRAKSLQQGLPTWEEYVRSLLGDETELELQFVLMMEQLGELLDQFRVQQLSLSSGLYQRVRTIHREPPGAPRVFLTRTLLHELLEEVTPCTSA